MPILVARRMPCAASLKALVVQSLWQRGWESLDLLTFLEISVESKPFEVHGCYTAEVEGHVV